jgi:hypothetical protein
MAKLLCYFFYRIYMKKLHITLSAFLLCAALSSFKPVANSVLTKDVIYKKSLDSRYYADEGEKLFMDRADTALTLMEQAAKKLPIVGVAVVSYIPGETTHSWISKMKVVGQMTRGSSNLLGVASTKAAEMADTFQDSGSGIRPPLKGEYGYQGGVIRKVSSGYIIAVFSGGSSAQDKEIAIEGADLLVKYFNSKK